MTVKELHEKLGELVDSNMGHYEVLTKDQDAYSSSGFSDYYACGVEVDDMCDLVSLEHDNDSY